MSADIFDVTLGALFVFWHCLGWLSEAFVRNTVSDCRETRRERDSSMSWLVMLLHIIEMNATLLCYYSHTVITKTSLREISLNDYVRCICR